MFIKVSLVLFSSITFSFAQTSSFVAASQNTQNATMQIDWSIGELITGNLSSNNANISHGSNEMGSVFIITGDIENSEAIATKIYPIPFISDLFIESDLNLKNHEITLLEESGKPISDIQIEFISDQKVKLNAGNIISGFYLLTLRSNTSIKTYKLIKK